MKMVFTKAEAIKKVGYLLILVFIVFLIDISDSAAQGTDSWSEPVLLFQVNDNEKILNPFVISDEYGNVHVVWSLVSENQSELDKIYYMRFDSFGWTTPVDIIAAKVARAPKITIGRDDYMYLIWQSVGDNIFMSRASIYQPEFVRSWSKPVQVAEGNPHAGIASLASGGIFVAYPGVGNSGVFMRVFVPDESSWSSSKSISPNSLINTGADDVTVEVSDNGEIHVVWTEYYLPDAWPPRGVFYVNSNDGGNTWSDAVMLAGDGYDEINISVQDKGNIHVAWNGMVGTVGGRYYRMSSDGGESWSQTFELVPAGIGGTEGPPQILVDSSGTLHVLTTYNGCPWYSFNVVGRWLPLVCISGEDALASGYIEEPAMTISEGNKLHVVFWDGGKRLWYTTKTTDAPWLAPEVMNSESYQPTPTSILSISSSVTPTLYSPELTNKQLFDTDLGLILDTGQILAISIIPVVLAVIFVVLIQSRKKD